MIASLSECVATVCVCVHPFAVRFTKDGKMGRFEVCHRFVLKFNRLKCDGQCLFLPYCNSCSACEMSFLTGKGCPWKYAHCRSPRQKKFMYIYIFTRTVRKALNAISDKNET